MSFTFQALYNQIKELKLPRAYYTTKALSAYLLKKPFEELTDHEYSLDSLEVQKVLNRLMDAEPLEYILGEVDFYRCKIQINQNVLIPRVETEILVDWIANNLKKSGRKPSVILDVCTGSGCIAISLKKLFPEAEVIGIDISKEAIDLAKKNALLNQVEVEFIQGDLLSSFHKKVDLVCSNPPYIRTKELGLLEASVKNYEPLIALDGGEDGLKFYKELENQLPQVVNLGGKVFFEIGYDQLEELKAIYAKGHWTNVNCGKDFSGHDRFFSLEFRGLNRL